MKNVNAQGLCGYNDWRLPNRLELLSLSQYQVGVPYSYFITQGLSYYGNTFWTSSTWYDNTLAGSYAWAVNLNSGYITIAEKTDLLAVQSQVVPVRGDSSGAPAPVPQTGSTHCYNTSGAQVTCSGTGQDGEYQAGVTLPNPRFTTNVDTTVTDNLTGLVWAPDANLVVSRDPTYDANGLMNWQKALDYIAKLNNESYLGYTDWRMPNVIEIQTLVNIGNAISNAAEFSNIQGIYWSSSTNYSGFQSYAWTTQIGPATLLYGGSNPTVHKDLFEYYVWPVR